MDRLDFPFFTFLMLPPDSGNLPFFCFFLFLPFIDLDRDLLLVFDFYFEPDSAEPLIADEVGVLDALVPILPYLTPY